MAVLIFEKFQMKEIVTFYRIMKWGWNNNGINPVIKAWDMIVNGCLTLKSKLKLK